MKKILFISTNDWTPWGGSEVLWYRTAKKIATEYDSIQVMVSVRKWYDEPAHISDLRKLKVKVGYRQLKAIPPLFFRLYNRFIDSQVKYNSNKNYYSDLLTDRPDLVIFSLGDHNSIVDKDISYCNTNNIPYVIVVQLAKKAQRISDGKESDIYKSNYLNASKIFFVSNQNLEIVQDTLATFLNNAVVISNPFPFEFTKKVNFPSIDYGFSVAFIASLSSNHKGHDVLFKVLSEGKWKQRPIVFNLYGSGPHSSYLKDLKSFYQLSNVIFRGKYESLQSVWEENHASILCSRFEGQSLALLEALSYERMCMATNVGDAKLLIDDGVTGFIAEAATFNLIDDMLERAWEKRNEWREMGIKGASKLSKLKSKEPVTVFCEKLLELIN